MPYFLLMICLKYVWNQILWQDITSVLMWGTTKTQCWWKRYSVDISFSKYLFVCYICNYFTFNWFTYEFVTCVITKKLHIVLIERFWIIHYFLTLFFQCSSYMSQFFWKTTCLSVITHFKLWFYRSVYRCCMWYTFFLWPK